MSNSNSNNSNNSNSNSSSSSSSNNTSISSASNNSTRRNSRDSHNAMRWSPASGPTNTKYANYSSVAAHNMEPRAATLPTTQRAWTHGLEQPAPSVILSMMLDSLIRLGRCPTLTGMSWPPHSSNNKTNSIANNNSSNTTA